MTLQQMRYFIAVAQNLSFSKAAQQHYVSQTAVSQQIKLLEEELETELFQRTRHSVALTSAGQVFYEYAVRITDLAEDAARRTRAAAAECSTPLEIGMMSGMENLPILEKLLLFKRSRSPTSCWPRRIPWSRKAPIPCRRRSWTASCSKFWWIFPP